MLVERLKARFIEVLYMRAYLYCEVMTREQYSGQK